MINDGLGLAIPLQRTDDRFACVLHGIVVQNRKIGFDRHTGNATRPTAQIPQDIDVCRQSRRAQQRPQGPGAG